MKYIRQHALGVLTLILIAVLSLTPAQEFPQVDVRFADKWVHWLMYGFLTMVWGVEHMVAVRSKADGGHGNSETTHTVSWSMPCIAIGAAIYGGIMELGQAYLTTSRSGDWLDAAANSFGALCAWLCLTVIHAVWKKHRHSS